MKIALIGISGRVGSRLAAELLMRGHQLTGIARDISKVEAKSGLSLKKADANLRESLTPVLAQHDVVISSTSFTFTEPAVVIDAVKKAGTPRLMVVGGAGGLEVAPGIALINAPDFPEAYMPEALGGIEFLKVLNSETELDWTFIAPSAEFDPGVRTGNYRLGRDQLLIDSAGRSWISMEDYAIAFADELENPQHSRQRFTVGY